MVRISPLPFREKAGFSITGLFFAFGSEAVVFVDIECVPRVVDPPVFYGQTAEVGDAFGDFADFGFDFFVQDGNADGAEIFFLQLGQTEIPWSCGCRRLHRRRVRSCLSVRQGRGRAIGFFDFFRTCPSLSLS